MNAYGEIFAKCCALAVKGEICFLESLTLCKRIETVDACHEVFNQFQRLLIGDHYLQIIYLFFVLRVCLTMGGLSAILNLLFYNFTIYSNSRQK